MTASIEPSSEDLQVRLNDGRRLGYARYGDPSGRPIVYFHGWPGSRLEARATDLVARKVGARIISVDRPGFGLSDFQPGRTLGSWAGDIAQLADAERLDRFAVLGISGGGPYAASCALMIPDRLTAAGIVCGLGPLAAPGSTDCMIRQNRWMLVFARRSPWIARQLFLRLARGLRGNPAGFISRELIDAMPAPDQQMLSRPEVCKIMADSALESLRHGPQGAVWEGQIYARPWDIRLEDIRMDVHLWHGEMDVNVPTAMGRYVASRIPHCRAMFLSDEGHISLPFNRIELILSTLIA